ncbi:DUF6177 family protein [Microbacterium sp. ET2]|uniref:DUF6177 family protein n=1 Tax=Microbacterium albipurpureum TaxID=3050384 RepID=UPI00259D310B|nr:DUF6177 family protein [Microbacterium sp. ET2 (Ac-2212)]WJL94492.1 DUF6177 family protein [Microbacterium sp. ET2 (Ac-2212)]
MTLTIDHPLADATGEGWVLTEIHSEVLSLSQGLSDLIGRTAAEGRRPLIVSGEHARMTEPLAEALSSTQGHWIVRTHADGFYDARSGTRLDAPAAVLSLGGRLDPARVHPAFLRATIRSRLQLVVTVSTRHRVSRPVRLGGVLDAVSEVVTQAPPTHWGALEPLLAEWDRDDLTERSRRRMPNDSRWVAVSASPRPLAATVHVSRTGQGLEETTRVVADVAGADDAASTDLAGLARRSLAAAATVGMPLIGVVLGSIGSPDLARRATASPAPEPLALLVGPPGVRALGVDAAAWTAQVGGTTVGSPRLPGVLIPLGSIDGGGWQRLDEVVAPLERERLWRLLGLSPAVARLFFEGRGTEDA